jgi:hypothetical protein
MNRNTWMQNALFLLEAPTAATLTNSRTGLYSVGKVSIKTI